DHLLSLTKMEYELLLYLLTNKNRVLAKEKIAAYVWEDHADTLVDFDFVYQHIKNLRKKMKALGAKPYIQTVYGLGYRFNSRI
ncbi:MAG: winged helix-turn-helix domain-containing protein, partial [Bacteroidota bacterium]